MKKSKIIVPALAMIAFSTAASIAGSVAWFTASRQVTVDAGTYSVVKTTTNLEYDVKAGIGTAKSGSAITLNGNYLTDASFAYGTQNIYIPNADGSAIASTVALADATATNMERATLDGGVKVYSVVTWELSLTMGFGATSGNYGLYLDQSASTITPSSSPAVTAKGFRMAFVPFNPEGYSQPEGSARDKCVFAPLQDFAGCKYVNDAGNKDGTAYTEEANVLVYQGYSTANPLPAEGTAAATAIARADYLGTFGFIANTKVTLCYKVVCWFDGTDANVVNQDDPTKYQSVESLLKFTAIKLG